MGTGIHNSSFTPKGFKDPSLCKHQTEEWGLGKNHFVVRSRTPECKSLVESNGVIMWHQPKQSAKKKANQQELPCICIVWVWSKLAGNLSSYPRSQNPGFPSFFQNGWHDPGGHVPLKKIALHACINVQNAKNSKASSQQTSTNIIHQCHQNQPVNQSVQSINESVFVQASGDLEDCWKQAHLPSAMIAPTAGATSLGSSMTQWTWRPNPNLSISAHIFEKWAGKD